MTGHRAVGGTSYGLIACVTTNGISSEYGRRRRVAFAQARAALPCSLAHERHSLKEQGAGTLADRVGDGDPATPPCRLVLKPVLQRAEPRRRAFERRVTGGRVIVNPGCLLRDPAEPMDVPARGTFGILDLPSTTFTVYSSRTGEVRDHKRTGVAGDRRVLLWLDDERPAPAGWTWVHTATEAIEWLSKGTVLEISLDHDLGDGEQAGTGYDVVCWIEEAVVLRAFVDVPESEIRRFERRGRYENQYPRAPRRCARCESCRTSTFTRGGPPSARRLLVGRACAWPCSTACITLLERFHVLTGWFDLATEPNLPTPSLRGVAAMPRRC